MDPVVGLDVDLDAALEVFRSPPRPTHPAGDPGVPRGPRRRHDPARDEGHPGPDGPSLRRVIQPASLPGHTLPNGEHYDQMVLATQIPFTSICEHHMLPFTGVAYLGYLPGDRILGLSKLARLVEHFAAAPQMQERLTKQIAEWLNEHLQPGGVGVVLQAEQTCMTLRGVQAHDARMVTSELLGALRDDPAARAEFYALTGVART